MQTYVLTLFILLYGVAITECIKGDGVYKVDTLNVVPTSSEVAHSTETSTHSTVTLAEPLAGEPHRKPSLPASPRSYCRYRHQQPKNEDTDLDPDHWLLSVQDDITLVNDNTTEVCSRGSHKCYSLWQEHENNTRTFIKQGCWEHPGHKDACNVSRCVAAGSVKQIPDAYYCCCSGSNCNDEVEIGKVPPVTYNLDPDPEEDYLFVDPSYKRRTILLAISSVLSVAVLIAVLYLIYHLCIGGHKCSSDQECSNHAPNDPRYGPLGYPNQLNGSLGGGDPNCGSLGIGNAVCDITAVKLKRILGRGHYGNVWQASVHGCKPVAIKVFSAAHESLYRNECDIYRLPHMDHYAITKFYGSHEGAVPARATRADLNDSDSEIDDEDDSLQSESLDHDQPSPHCFAIIMNYIPGGTLTKYLKENTIDWYTLCKMSHSISAGLAHLHSDVNRNGELKPAVAHRDINTRNILVHRNLTCVICDFGLAMRVSGNKYLESTGDEHGGGEQPSLRDVGTLRYMAPEVLEGAVNLRDCASSLKQIDVYALGLVLWEVASRCHDLYQGLPVPMYQLPYQNELGAHPSFEEIQQLVVMKKERPPKPDVWKDTNLAIKALKDTLEDCWDQDAEARLTAPCVKERVNDYSNLWIARNKGVTATINQTMSPHSCDEDSDNEIMSTRHLLCSDAEQNHRNSMHNAMQDIAHQSQSENDGRYMRLSSASTSSSGPSGVGNRSSVYSLSTATTDTILSPSTENEVIDTSLNVPPVLQTKANCNLFAHNRMNVPVRQGSNPTFERNTHKCSDEQLAIMGNNLVDRRFEDGEVSTLGRRYRLAPEPFESVAGRLETSLVQSDMLSRQIEVAVAATAPHGDDVNLLENHHIEEEPTAQADHAPVFMPMATRQPKMYNTEVQNGVGCPRTDIVTDCVGVESNSKLNKKSKNWFQRLFSRPSRSEKSQVSTVQPEESVSNHSGYDDEAYPTENLCALEPGVAAMTSVSGTTSVGVITMDTNPEYNRKSNLCPRSPATSQGDLPSSSSVSTEVRMVNGMPIVRPASLNLSNVTPRSSGSRHGNRHYGDVPGRVNTQNHTTVGNRQSTGALQPSVARVQSAAQLDPQINSTLHTNSDVNSSTNDELSQNIQRNHTDTRSTDPNSVDNENDRKASKVRKAGNTIWCNDKHAPAVEVTGSTIEAVISTVPANSNCDKLLLVNHCGRSSDNSRISLERLNYPTHTDNKLVDRHIPVEFNC